mmetsp:Transcript_38914/g.83380  ORF Transcript_38914/g.83380 Transcript_38914/m.83380 type:complete len:176 (-) Transcript_38914:261-788(-)|eukprot:CAMPEP_0197485762 /NCGR_PEP_ID=MMETSP1311-20131121/686_1 /TAXON_ID=464262 /ORGANISM="Genus nov. species nov., Strain RCC856" /LENGTH=175 /DNA_ID=CAMNT_0043028509 /DNA_START=53 /DNA_END=580 /DNA_ORIENTATION=+
MAGCAKGQQDLVDLIDWKSVEVLNQSSEHTWENALKKGYRESDSVYLESDCDEQILLHIPFSQQVKIHSFALHHSERDFAPSGVKLFVNQPTIGFDEAEDFEGTQTIDLSEADVLEGNAVALKFVKFQKVTSLTLFIPSNFADDDITRVGRLLLFGQPVFTTNMSKEAWDKACKT